MDESVCHFFTRHLEVIVTLEIHFIYRGVERGFGVTSLLKTQRAQGLASDSLCCPYRPS